MKSLTRKRKISLTRKQQRALKLITKNLLIKSEPTLKKLKPRKQANLK